MSEHRLLAKITSTHLGWEDHGIFTAWLTVDYETGGTQGIGTHCLGSEKHGVSLSARRATGTSLRTARAFRASASRR